MTNLDSILKSRGITLLTKVRIVKAMISPAVKYGCKSWTMTEGWMPKNWCFPTVVLEKTLERQGDQTSPSQRKSILNMHWKERCCSWNSNTLATWCEDPTYWKRLWCCERLKAWGEGGVIGWDVWMASRNTNLHKLREIAKNKGTWHAAIHGITELDMT